MSTCWCSRNSNTVRKQRSFSFCECPFLSFRFGWDFDYGQSSLNEIIDRELLVFRLNLTVIAKMPHVPTICGIRREPDDSNRRNISDRFVYPINNIEDGTNYFWRPHKFLFPRMIYICEFLSSEQKDSLYLKRSTFLQFNASNVFKQIGLT